MLSDRNAVLLLNARWLARELRAWLPIVAITHILLLAVRGTHHYLAPILHSMVIAGYSFLVVVLLLLFATALVTDTPLETIIFPSRPPRKDS